MKMPDTRYKIRRIQGWMVDGWTCERYDDGVFVDRMYEDSYQEILNRTLRRAGLA